MTLLKAIDEIDFPFFLPVDTTIIEKTYENTKNGEFFKTREIQKELTFRTPSKNDISVVSKDEFFWILIIILGMSVLIIWLVRKMSSEQSDSVTKTENYLKKSTYKPARNERSPKKDKNSKISIKNQKPVASKPHARVNEELTLFATTSKDMELESNSQPKNDFLTSTINSPRVSEEKKIMAKKFRSFSLMEVEQAYKEVLHAFKVEECSRMTIPQWQMLISDKLFKVEELSDDVEIYMSDEDEEDNEYANVEALYESDIDECLICFELLKDNLGYLASCGHVFHRDCIKKWMDKSVNCPKCRAVY